MLLRSKLEKKKECCVLKKVRRGNEFSLPDFWLEEFQLLVGGIGLLRFFTIKKFDALKLFVRYSKDAYLTVFGHIGFDSLHVDSGVFATSTMAHVNGKLKHGKAIAHYVFAESGGIFAFLTSGCWKVEKH